MDVGAVFHSSGFAVNHVAWLLFKREARKHMSSVWQFLLPLITARPQTCNSDVFFLCHQNNRIYKYFMHCFQTLHIRSKTFVWLLQMNKLSLQKEHKVLSPMQQKKRKKKDLLQHYFMSAHPVEGSSFKPGSRIIAWLITHSLGSIHGQASEWALMGLKQKKKKNLPALCRL